MKIPKMLADYLEETEQTADEMSFAELFEEESWVLSCFNMGDFGDYGDNYSKSDVTALKRFIYHASCRMIERK